MRWKLLRIQRFNYWFGFLNSWEVFVLGPPKLTASSPTPMPIPMPLINLILTTATTPLISQLLLQYVKSWREIPPVSPLMTFSTTESHATPLKYFNRFSIICTETETHNLRSLIVDSVEISLFNFFYRFITTSFNWLSLNCLGRIFCCWKLEKLLKTSVDDI